MKKDSILSKFEQEKIDMSQIKGGDQEVTGGSQDGNNSYVDYTDENGADHCEVFYSSHDGSDWINHLPKSVNYECLAPRIF